MEEEDPFDLAADGDLGLRSLFRPRLRVRVCLAARMGTRARRFRLRAGRTCRRLLRRPWRWYRRRYGRLREVPADLDEFFRLEREAEEENSPLGLQLLFLERRLVRLTPELWALTLLALAALRLCWRHKNVR